MEKLHTWLLHVIKKQWRCRFVFINGIEFIGVPTCFDNNKIEVYTLDEDGYKADLKGFYALSEFESIETIENELRKYLY